MPDLLCDATHNCRTWWRTPDDLGKHKWLAHGIEIPKREEPTTMTTELVAAPCGAKVPAGKGLGGHKGRCRACRRITHPPAGGGLDDGPTLKRRRGRLPGRPPKKKMGRPPKVRETVAERTDGFHPPASYQSVEAQLERLVATGKAAEAALVALRKVGV